MGDEEGLYRYGEKELWETEEGCRYCYGEGFGRRRRGCYWVWEKGRLSPEGKGEE